MLAVGLHILKVNRQCDMCHLPLAQCGSAVKIGYIFNVRWPHDPRVIRSYIHEQPVESYILLCERVVQVMKRKASDCKHRLAVQLGIIKTIEQVNASGAGGSQADAQLSGVLGVSTRHEGCGLFMPHLHKPDL